MTLRKVGAAHTGVERYEVELRYEGRELAEVNRLTSVGDPVADTVHLIWVRSIGGIWSRYVNTGTGSRIEGWTKVDENGTLSERQMGRRSREIYTRGTGELRRWAALLPGLRLAVEEAEMSLPE